LIPERVVPFDKNYEPIPVTFTLLNLVRKDADFLYDTIETYIKDAEKANKSDLVEILQTIKIDRKRHMHQLKRHWKKRFMDKILYRCQLIKCR